ncbi:(2Fe-2S)-binding protein [Histidinibacterium lentulum]|nr:2Fe-2S iron-sulfur cluster-binding protein [Histidinibacterium lentulum]
MSMDDPRPYDLTVDGRAVRVTARPDTPVLSVLRDDLGLLGTRTGCLQGRCGSCTVHLDGKAVQTCSLPLWSVEGRRIDTVEGPSPTLARVREAFLEEQAAQCGYCVNGIMMTVSALLDEGVRDRSEMLETLDERHLCRCGAHPRMLRAIDRLLEGAA